MSRRRRSPRKTKPVRPVQPTQAPPRRLALGKRIAFAAVITVGFFCLLELALAAFGWRASFYEHDPYVGFSSYARLYVARAEPGRGTMLATAENKLAWFNAQEFAQQKPPGTYRVFCLGGSTTYGRPYDDQTSFAGWLRELLPAADDSRTWEVINAGGISYASYRVANVMRELVDYEPDLFVIYAGHNEFLEARTYQQLSATPALVRNLGSLCSRTRVYAALSRLVGREQRDRQPRDGRSLLPSEVKTLLDSAIGPEVYHRDDQLRENILQHFEFNLRRMIELARSHGADVILVTPASNLADCSPFKAENGPAIDAQQLDQWSLLLDHAGRSFAAGRLDEARQVVEQAVRADERHAGASYLRGQILLQLGQWSEAKQALVRARDEDVCTLRAPTEIGEIVRQLALEMDVPLVDFEAHVQQLSPHTIPGNNLFLDHVHPTIEGHRELALLLVIKMGERGALTPSADWGAETIETVSQRVMSRVDTAKQAAALRNLSKVLSWAGKHDEADRLALEAIQLMPDDAKAQYQAGNAYLRRGDVEEAIRRYQRSLELDPHEPATHYGLGLAFSEKGDAQQAILHYREAVSIDPQFGDAHYNLARLYEDGGNLEAAMRHYRRAISSNPGDYDAHNNLGVLLARQEQWGEAQAQFEQALRLNAAAVDARLNLGRVLAQQGNLDAARNHFREVLRRFPGHPGALAELENSQ